MAIGPSPVVLFGTATTPQIKSLPGGSSTPVTRRELALVLSPITSTSIPRPIYPASQSPVLPPPSPSVVPVIPLVVTPWWPGWKPPNRLFPSAATLMVKRTSNHSWTPFMATSASTIASTNPAALNRAVGRQWIKVILMISTNPMGR